MISNEEFSLYASRNFILSLKYNEQLGENCG